MTARLAIYRVIQTRVVLPMVASRWRAGRVPFSTMLSSSAPNARRVWVHAASVGELESLWTVAVDLAREGCELVLTTFSASARVAVERLGQSVESIRPGACLWSGVSPFEGEWKQALESLRPQVFVTAKYEAWPELWASLSLAGIPLVVVGAKARPSLKTAFRAVCWLGVKAPRVTFLAARREDQSELSALDPSVVVEAPGDPRWDRVLSRLQSGSPRARQLVERCTSSLRPWGIVGSAWIEDLDVLEDSLRDWNGTLWVVPHRVDEGHVALLRDRLRSQGYAVTLSSSGKAIGDGHRSAILVDEMGFLSELYASGDWAWVGGGFGAGIHSTLEPALQGIPIAGGAARADRFAEVAELLESGQLTLVRTPKEVARWIAEKSVADPELRERWKTEARARLGATGRVVAQIVSKFGA